MLKIPEISVGIQMKRFVLFSSALTGQFGIMVSTPNKGKEPVCQKWNGEFSVGNQSGREYSDRNMWTASRGDPEHSGPGYSGQKKPKRTFPFEFRPKFPESLA